MHVRWHMERSRPTEHPRISLGVTGFIAFEAGRCGTQTEASATVLARQRRLPYPSTPGSGPLQGSP